MKVKEADLYFKNRPYSSAWNECTEETKRKLLTFAVGQLEPFKKTVSYKQYNQAVYEQAFWLLKEDSRSELQQAGVVSFSVGGLSEHFDSKGRPMHISPKAWIFLQGPSVRLGQLK